MNIGVNFFGPKRELYHNFDRTLDILKKSGVEAAELCIGFGENNEPPEEFKLLIPPEVLEEMSGGIWDQSVAEERLNMVRAKGFQVISAHIMLGAETEPAELAEMLPDIIEFGKKNQIPYFVISLMKNLTGMKRYAEPLRQMSEALDEAGIKLAYHNHETECITEDGTTALDYILEQCPLLKLELDVGWAKFAGASPVEFMRKYRDRLELLHLKDIREDASPETRDTCFTAVGEGSIPLAEIMQEAQKCPIADYGIIIDQDDSETDILDDLARGVQHIQSVMKRVE